MFRKNLRPKFVRPKTCFFCDAKTEPSFFEFENLKKFISERGKIFGRERTGLCRKHQSRMTVNIKRARILALLPFTAKIK